MSWVTQDEPGSSQVLYGTSEDNLEFSAEGEVNHYTYYNYTSGFIHHCTLRKLKVINFVKLCRLTCSIRTPFYNSDFRNNGAFLLVKFVNLFTFREI